MDCGIIAAASFLPLLLTYSTIIAVLIVFSVVVSFIERSASINTQQLDSHLVIGPGAQRHCFSLKDQSTHFIGYSVLGESITLACMLALFDIDYLKEDVDSGFGWEVDCPS
jgi:hypothetical protein